MVKQVGPLSTCLECLVLHEWELTSAIVTKEYVWSPNSFDQAWYHSEF